MELRTQAGVPVQGATVAWLALSGGGQVSPAASRTDGEGRARAAWTLGTAAGTATASARVDDGALAFSATALAGAPAAVRVLAGDGQSGTRGTILDDSLAVRVTDAWGNPVAGAQVSWTVHEGGGHLERQASTTNAAGVATTRWAVGFTPGENRAAASLDGGAGAPFTATGTEGTLTLSAVDRTRTTRPLMSTWRRQGPISAHVTDSQGRRAIGAPIQWESNENPAVSPATEWDTSSVATVDTWYGTWVPFPYSIAHFEGQRRVLNVPIWPTMYWVLDLPQGAGPYSANDSVAVVFRLVWDDTGINHGAEVPAPVQMHDDAGWTATTRTFVQVRWPLGSRTGSRKLTACLPEPYVFAEPYVTGCADVTITVVP
ncbi:MAG TPA: Ig-like domain-containing protein [Longimicrobium sp.]